jgi:hypothetical protein
MSDDPVYGDYWRRKKLLAGGVPRFPLTRWWPADGLCPSEAILFDAVRSARRLLDVGAGDLRMMKKLIVAGFAGEYETQDVGSESSYTYADLASARPPYDAVLCLNVLEHLPLRDGLAMLTALTGMLAPGGVLALETPNARCVRDPLSWDMTHLHCYNAPDLWAYLACRGLDVRCWRVVFGERPAGPFAWLAFAARAAFVSRVLGCDHADNLLLLARKPLPTE